MFTIKNGHRAEVDPPDAGTTFFEAPEYFTDNVGTAVRRISYLSWAYQELAEAFFDPRVEDDGNAYIVELGTILLAIIADDMKRLDGMREKAGELLLEATGAARRRPMPTQRARACRRPTIW